MAKVMITLISIVLCQILYCYAKITDKEYASMPELFHLDNYDTCMLLEDEALYCTIDFDLEPINKENPPKVWQIIQEVSSEAKNYRHDKLRHGVCIPKTCPNIGRNTSNMEDFSKKLAKCYREKYTDMGLTGTISRIECQTNEKRPIDTYDIIVAVVIIGYVIFVILASFYEGVARYKTKEEYDKIVSTPHGKFLAAFSLPKNWYRLTTVHETPDINALRSIQGIRFYNMVIVITAHTVMLALIGPVINTKYTETMTEKFLNMFLANGGYAVQTFFLISGWLLAYNFFVLFEGQKEIKVKYLISAFINRYIRLTPTLALMIALHSTWLMHASRGPFWDRIVGDEFRNCRKNGWSNLLYINNYVDPTNMCYTESWYLANDNHFSILQFTLLYFMIKYRDKVWWILGGTLFCQVFFMGLVMYIGDYPISVKPTPEGVLFIKVLREELWLILIASPYSNASGCTIGLAYGYLFYKYRNKKLFTKKIYVAIWWFITFGLPLGIIIIPGLHIFSPNYTHDPIIATLYVATGRAIFAFGIGCGIFGNSQGIGWMMKWVCEWRPTYILGRITYSAFLVHYIILLIRAGEQRSPFFITDFAITSEALAQISIAYIAALILTLFLELPVSGLQKLILKSQPVKNEKKIEGAKTKKER